MLESYMYTKGNKTQQSFLLCILGNKRVPFSLNDNFKLNKLPLKRSYKINAPLFLVSDVINVSVKKHLKDGILLSKVHDSVKIVLHAHTDNSFLRSMYTA